MLHKQLHLKYDPLEVFGGSRTPAGLYARQKWRNEEGSEEWHRDFEATVKELRADQSDNGSWDNSLIVTVQRLFGLHLTVRERDESIRQSLEWLLGVDALRNFRWFARGSTDEMQNDKTNEIGETLFHDLPFVSGCLEHFVVCATLFLANCFGMGDERRILKFYGILAGKVQESNGHWCSIACTNNALRAFVVHGQYSKSKATEMMVIHLMKRQLVSGAWKGRIPLYLTFNALAHLNSVGADIQCRKAAGAMLKGQNKDGSWGRKHREWNTFLVVHALNRLNADRSLR